MKQCSSCRYFGPRDGVLVWDPHKCDLVETEHHLCNRIEHAHAYSPLHAVTHDPAIVTCNEKQGHLRVLPTFGCCLHIPKIDA